VKIPPSEQEAIIAPSLNLLSNEKVKRALDILTLSVSNRVFGEENLLAVTSKARGHGKLVIETLFYGMLNPNDFSLLKSFTK